MSGQSEACRANALHCLEIADKACTQEDECEFVGFAQSWQRLANEIEHAECLIALIDELAGGNPSNDAAEWDREQLRDRSSAHSLQRLTTAILSISSHFIAEHFAARGLSKIEEPS